MAYVPVFRGSLKKWGAVCGVITVLALSVALVVVGAPTAWYWWVAAALLGWWLADAISGTVHMVLDYHPCRNDEGMRYLLEYRGNRSDPEYITKRNEIFSGLTTIERMAFDFKTHHQKPGALGRRSFFALALSTFIGALIPIGGIAVTLMWTAYFFEYPLPQAVPFGFIFMYVGGGFAQYHHGLIHRAHQPLVIRALRRVGILMSQKQHLNHHLQHDRQFSVLNGWSNPAVNLLHRIFVYLRIIQRDDLLEILQRTGYLNEDGRTSPPEIIVMHEK